MKNETALPEEIIELLSKSNFAGLSSGEQQMVRSSMTEMAFNELYAAQYAATQYFEADRKLSPSASLKQNLDIAFRQRHPKRPSVLLQPVALWKVAAVFLLLFSGTALYLNKNNFSNATETVFVHDTIFADKKIEVIRHIIDTVVAYQYAATATGKVQKRVKPALPANEENRDTVRVWKARREDIGIRTLQPEDLIKDLPNRNGKSMQEDELVRTFGFARI